MFRRSFLGVVLAALGGLAFGKRAQSASAPPPAVPSHIKEEMEEVDWENSRKLFFSVEVVDGQEVWFPCYFTSNLTYSHKKYFTVQKVDDREVWTRCHF